MTQNTIKTVNVELGKNRYPIHIGSGLLHQTDVVQAPINTKQVCIVSNRVIADLYLSTLIDSLSKDKDLIIETVILPEGETNKNQTVLNTIFDQLIEKQFSRDCLMIALGGGIVGDMTGFVAACYQRGVDFMQIPTTLLAQVDSSVGGKTGINHRLGKNLIGAFYQPQAVIIDTDVLNSLPKREIAAGMAEVIKYGFIRDKDFLHRLDTIIDETIALSPAYLAEIIHTSCQHKADVVANDEKEKGERATLNFGHTFGHAIEALTEYKTYLHGEAIAIGMMMALELSHLLGNITETDVAFAEQLLKRANCPTRLSNTDSLLADEVYQAMQRDKKVAKGKLKLILLEKLGKSIIRDDIEKDLVLQAIGHRLG